MAEKHRKHQLLGALFVALLSLPALMPTVARADASAQVLGATIGEWSARWWQWALGIPAPINPVSDLTGANCGVGQQGPVWFLAGTGFLSPPPGPVTRDCQVPAQRYIFFPDR